MVFYLNTEVNRKFMKIKDYLREEKITYSKFAELLGIHIQSLKNISNGNRRPSLVLAIKIEKLTGGKITASQLAEDFESYKKDKNKSQKNMLEEKSEEIS
jgi:DNA-binding XRE family transcriptional regulator